eukprot:GEMP01000495.1.p1 GENE.GEMP01000495.1~~GEMP01000495.1.p1  ORF type:complete len:1392 (+),score=278.77 GEMP01000495.1:601-4776(+)
MAGTHRHRTIIVAPMNGGNLCDAKDSLEVKSCGMQQCPTAAVNCAFSDWEPWEPCPVSCGGAKRPRKRTIETSAVRGGETCEGLLEEWGNCGTEACTVPGIDCFFGIWSPWSGCSCLCNGHQSRTRDIGTPASQGGSLCEGPISQLMPCNVGSDACKDFARNCKFTEWTKWSTCSATCNGGQHQRTRQVAQRAKGHGIPCDGQLTELEGCGQIKCTTSAIDCAWGDWSAWCDCTASCDGGTQARIRDIKQYACDGGKACEIGASREARPCNEKPCMISMVKCQYHSWGSWGACSATCGVGLHFRNRTLESKTYQGPLAMPMPKASTERRQEAEAENVLTDDIRWERRLEARNLLGTDDCRGMQQMVEGCNTHSCVTTTKVDAKFDDWSRWSACACGGAQTRHRVIIRHAEGGGKLAEGPQEESRPCKATGCHDLENLDCGWDAWGPWSACPVLCGKGQINRKRVVAVAAKGHGKDCNIAVDGQQTLPCNTQPCQGPQDCKWGVWTDWTICDKFCGGGERTRMRIIEVAPHGGGKTCDPKTSMEMSACNMQSCEKDVRCNFAEWKPWSPCSRKCGSGFRSRTRGMDSLAQDKAFYEGCQGKLDQVETCNTGKCPGKPVIDCVFSSWTPYSDCSCPCNGKRLRNREISRFPSEGGKPCLGPIKEVDACNTNSAECKSESTDCKFAPWSHWGKCAEPCGGQRSRARAIAQDAKGQFGEPCVGPLEHVEGCNGLCLPEKGIDCQYETWSVWTECTKSCGEGERSRSRMVEVPPSKGGRACDIADLGQMETCNDVKCPAKIGEACEWKEWSHWTKCSATCDGGQKMRNRSLLLSNGEQTPECSGEESHTAGCGQSPCVVEAANHPVNCVWSEWQEWGSCCCLGIHARQRNWITPGRYGGKPCTGVGRETASCVPENCTEEEPICMLHEWSMWSKCTVTCGGGQTFRSRSYMARTEGTGKGCEGDLEETRECGQTACTHRMPIDCLWSVWEEWSICSKSIGIGEKIRHRHITVAPKNGGKMCPETDILQVQSCNAVDATQLVLDCLWSTWGLWSTCSQTCGNGWRSRSRDIQHDNSVGGAPCKGVYDEWQHCELMECPGSRDCIMGQWGVWNECSSECAGHRTRARSILLESEPGGKPCQEAMEETMSCNVDATSCGHRVDQNCAFVTWSLYTECTKTCGGGQKSRTRQIGMEATGHGKPCVGPTMEIVSCSLIGCPGTEAIPCQWGLWSIWSICDKECDGGQQKRTRTISERPRRGGKSCEAGAADQVQVCNITPCLTRKYCAWSAWGEWSACDQQCGTGAQTRKKRLHYTHVMPLEMQKKLYQNLNSVPDNFQLQETGTLTIAFAIIGLVSTVVLSSAMVRLVRQTYYHRTSYEQVADMEAVYVGESGGELLLID